MPRPKALDHVVLKVADMDKTLHFYQHVLGLELLRTSGPSPAGGRSAVIKVGGQEINVFSDPDFTSVNPENAAGMDHFCLTMEAASVEELIADLRRAGVESFRGPVQRRDGISVFVYDPDGVRVELRLAAGSDREIVTTRVLDAQRELVFTAFSDSAHLVHWWGPKGFTSTFHEFDMRPGGAWRFILHGPDGANYPNESVFVEVVKPERIVFKHVSGPKFEMTITLAEQAGKTRLGWRMLFDSAAECARVKKFAVGANEQNLDRLEAQLARMATLKR